MQLSQLESSIDTRDGVLRWEIINKCSHCFDSVPVFIIISVLLKGFDSLFLLFEDYMCGYISFTVLCVARPLNVGRQKLIWP